MNLTDFQFAIEEVYLESEIVNNEIDIIESSYISNIRLATKATTLYCMRENAGVDIFNAYEADSSESFFTKMKNAFIKRYNTVKNFVLTCIDKVKAYFQAKAINNNLKKFEKAIKENPTLAGIEIDIPVVSVDDVMRANKELEEVQRTIFAVDWTHFDPVKTQHDIQAMVDQSVAITGVGMVFEDGPKTTTSSRPSFFKRGKIKLGEVLKNIKSHLKLLEKFKDMVDNIAKGTSALLEKAKTKGASAKNRIMKILSVGKARLKIMNNAIHNLTRAISETLRNAFATLKKSSD